MRLRSGTSSRGPPTIDLKGAIFGCPPCCSLFRYCVVSYRVSQAFHVAALVSDESVSVCKFSTL
jgi:hypothetical protein